MYLLDTCVVAELRRPQPNPAVVVWLTAVPDPALHLCALTLGEIQAGVEQARDQDPDLAAEIETWLEVVAELYNVLPLDGATYRRCAVLRHHNPDTTFEDALVAACALEHHLTVVTRNVHDFQHLEVPLVNPFDQQQPRL